MRCWMHSSETWGAWTWKNSTHCALLDAFRRYPHCLHALLRGLVYRNVHSRYDGAVLYPVNGHGRHFYHPLPSLAESRFPQSGELESPHYVQQCAAVSSQGTLSVPRPPLQTSAACRDRCPHRVRLRCCILSRERCTGSSSTLVCCCTLAEDRFRGRSSVALENQGPAALRRARRSAAGSPEPRREARAASRRRPLHQTAGRTSAPWSLESVARLVLAVFSPPEASFWSLLLPTAPLETSEETVLGVVEGSGKDHANGLTFVP